MPFLDFWLSLIRSQQVNFYMTLTDSKSFMAWRDWSIEGVPNVTGVC